MTVIGCDIVRCVYRCRMVGFLSILPYCVVSKDASCGIDGMQRQNEAGAISTACIFRQRQRKKKKWRSALKSYRRVDISMCVPSCFSRLTAFHRISIFSLFTYLFYFLFTSSTHFLSAITPQITLNSALFFAQRTKARRYKHPGSTYYVG